jgi:hypothetical protein
LPKITDKNSKLILFADDTSIIITSLNPTIFENNVNKIFHDINRWFHTNLLPLNLDKTHYMQFVAKSSSIVDLKVIHGSNNITNICSTKFLGITLDNTFSWRTHIDMIITKLSSACFAIRAVKPFLSSESLKMVYHSYFHSIMTYGIIFWGNSYYSNTIFSLQRKLLELLWGLETGILAENTSRNEKYCH